MSFKCSVLFQLLVVREGRMKRERDNVRCPTVLKANEVEYLLLCKV